MRSNPRSMITKQQYRKLMSEYQETRNLTQSAMKAGMSRQIARKYLNECKPPAELQAKHTWRTREDPLAGIWPQACAMLEEAPDLEAKMLFEHLLERSPEAAQEQHLRTFQRRVKLWRLAQGPDKEVFFPQDWEPGRVMELDWTNCWPLRLLGILMIICCAIAFWRIPTGIGLHRAFRSRCCPAAKVCRTRYTGWVKCPGNCESITAVRPRTAWEQVARAGSSTSSLSLYASTTGLIHTPPGLSVQMRTVMWNQAMGI